MVKRFFWNIFLKICGGSGVAKGCFLPLEFQSYPKSYLAYRSLKSLSWLCSRMEQIRSVARIFFQERRGAKLVKPEKDKCVNNLKIPKGTIPSMYPLWLRPFSLCSMLKNSNPLNSVTGLNLRSFLTDKHARFLNYEMQIYSKLVHFSQSSVFSLN